MEDPEVFARVHAFAYELVREGLLDGFRIDHVDGLFDPGDYLERLQRRARDVRPDLFSADRPLFVVVEKILGLDEPLPEWPTQGTTGYDFLAQVNGLFVDRQNEKPFNAVYENFARLRTSFREIAYRSKQLVLRLSMASELNVLAHQLNRFSERNRHYRDFTLNSLTQAIREIIATFPVYRTYVNEREAQIGERDRQYVEYAVAEAKRRNPGRPRAVFHFVRDLLLKQADFISASDRSEHLQFVGKFQQVTSPVTAKGIEDTAMYNYNRLVSVNDVGCEPDRFGVAPDRLHAWLQMRAATWPHALSATSSHDTKRSEDVRARLNILSELPGAWKQAIARWARINRRARTIVDGVSYPSRNEEYLLYQTLVGTWPFAAMDEKTEEQYRERIVQYMLKAIREAKVVTSWINPSERHEAAMVAFVAAILAPDNTAFREDFLPFQQRIARLGIYTSLAQLALKIGAPGIPDFYQGTELWEFSLVDPDNRRPVDYHRRMALLAEIQQVTIDDVMSDPTDDRLKLFVSARLLHFRRECSNAFAFGSYEALAVEGARRDHAFAFTRRHEGRTVVVVVPRLVAGLVPDADAPPLGERVWGDTRVHVPDERTRCYRHALTGGCVPIAEGTLRLADVFGRAPVAFLDSHSHL
jgi:(1->4)-alpha-D-glucan 1-alpha-D-glucosylmutase